MTGVGGDCFALIQIGGGDIIGINGSGHAPAGLSLEFLEDRNISAIEVSSPHGVTIPGAVDTWSRLSSDYGKLGLDACLQPAIRYAEDGFAVAPRVAVDWRSEEHTSELQSLMRISYAVFGLKKKTKLDHIPTRHIACYAYSHT